MLTPGEHVTNAVSTSKWLPTLQAINNDDQVSVVQSIAPRGIPQFATGGQVGGVSHMGSRAAAGAQPYVLQIHPDFAKTTLGDWFNGEMARNYSQR
jgi:hypothetical protein